MKTLTPLTSLGSRSGVNWIRLKLLPTLRAIALARTVFPTPGTSSIRTWPRHSSATRTRLTSRRLPTIDSLDIVRDQAGQFANRHHWARWTGTGARDGLAEWGCMVRLAGSGRRVSAIGLPAVEGSLVHMHSRPSLFGVDLTARRSNRPIEVWCCP